MDVNQTLFTIEAFHWNVPAWVMETILPAGFALIAIRLVAHALASMLGVRVKPKEPVAS
jgi:TRAP-type C4-dicarboxylate transport system permease small subunit